VRHRAARVVDGPPELLLRLALGDSAAVRGAVAANPATPGAVLDLLARDPIVMVRRHVSVHENTTARALLQLSRDPVMGIRNNAITRCERLLELGQAFASRSTDR